MGMPSLSIWIRHNIREAQLSVEFDVKSLNICYDSIICLIVGSQAKRAEVAQHGQRRRPEAPIP